MSVTSIVQLNVTGVKDMIPLDPWLLVSRLKSYGLLNTTFTSLALNGTLFSCIATSRMDKFWPVSAALSSGPIQPSSINGLPSTPWTHAAPASASTSPTFARQLVLDQRPVVSCTCSNRKFKSSRQPGPPNRWKYMEMIVVTVEPRFLPHAGGSPWFTMYISIWTGWGPTSRIRINMDKTAGDSWCWWIFTIFIPPSLSP